MTQNKGISQKTNGVFTPEQDNDKTNVEPVHSYDAFHTRPDKPGVKGIIEMHRFNICLVVVLLWCENTITLVHFSTQLSINMLVACLPFLTSPLPELAELDAPESKSSSSMSSKDGIWGTDDPPGEWELFDRLPISIIGLCLSTSTLMQETRHTIKNMATQDTPIKTRQPKDQI